MTLNELVDHLVTAALRWFTFSVVFVLLVKWGVPIYG
jgi:hypothetical protein